jgi:hypothetical protein
MRVQVKEELGIGEAVREFVREMDDERRLADTSHAVDRVHRHRSTGRTAPGRDSAARAVELCGPAGEVHGVPKEPVRGAHRRRGRGLYVDVTGHRAGL